MIRPIIQFSPVRSGSTVVASLLRRIFPGVTVRKIHSMGTISRKLHLFLNGPVVSTYRYPLDSVASELKYRNMKPSALAIEKACQNLERKGLLELNIVLNRKNVLLLKYEEYYGDFDFLFDCFEDFFSIDIDENVRTQLKDDFSIESVERLTKGMKARQYTDEKTHFHGRHISDTKGAPGAYQSFFTEEQIEWLRYRFSSFIQDFGYLGDEIDNTTKL